MTSQNEFEPRNFAETQADEIMCDISQFMCTTLPQKYMIKTHKIWRKINTIQSLEIRLITENIFIYVGIINMEQVNVNTVERVQEQDFLLIKSY